MPIKKKRSRGPAKPTVKKRAVNAQSARPKTRAKEASSPGAEQDIKRRLGDFTGKGEHARVGSRTAGIVGQTKRAFRTDNKRTKSKASMGKPDKAR